MDAASPDAPAFFALLDAPDQRRYLELRSDLHHSAKRYKRNKRVESLEDALNAIRAFSLRHDPDDWKRFLVCGVCWMGQDVGVNVRQLRLLVDKCKSSINGALSKMGYGAAPATAASVLSCIPALRDRFVEQRQWTVRRRARQSPAPARPSLPTPILNPPAPPPCASPDAATPLPPFGAGAAFDFGHCDLQAGREWPPAEPMYNFIDDPCCCCPLNWQRAGGCDDLFDMA
jgi:hypothetical protein